MAKLLVPVVGAVVTHLTAAASCLRALADAAEVNMCFVCLSVCLSVSVVVCLSACTVILMSVCLFHSFFRSV